MLFDTIATHIPSVCVQEICLHIMPFIRDTEDGHNEDYHSLQKKFQSIYSILYNSLIACSQADIFKSQPVFIKPCVLRL